MLDTDAVNKLVSQQITAAVNAQVQAVMSSDDWLILLEDKILKYTQDRILAKFNNSSTMPEIVEAVKTSVTKLFADGHIPGIDQYVDNTVITQSIATAVDQTIQSALADLGQDPVWLAGVETTVKQNMVLETISRIGSIDINTIIRQRVDENMQKIRQEFITDFSSTGIDDQATECQLTIMDDTTVVENRLTTADLTVVNGARINDLSVTGSINTDNPAWTVLADNISDNTLKKLSEKWRNELVQQITDQIRHQGIEFDAVTIGGDYVVAGNRLSKAITESSLQSVGVLNQLSVAGETHLNNTLSVVKNRLGINTDSPESALSVWDEEVSVIVGKHKAKHAYIGTARDQTLSLGVNRTPYLDIDNTGLTTVKKLQVGVHKFSHATQVPGWLGTKGDIVFNANPGPDRVFAWICTGSYNWQVIKGAE
jgi:hypothetical protein